MNRLRISILLVIMFLVIGCAVTDVDNPTTEIDQNIADTVQEQNIPANIPILEDHDSLTVEDWIISYSTPMTFSEVITFYRQTMPDLNWKNNAAASHTDAEMKNSKLTYFNETQTISISILNQGESTLVTIILKNK